MNNLTSMRVIARTKDAVYVRLPRELQRDAAGCGCEHCKKDPALAKWDTLVIPTEETRRAFDFTWTVHMPDGAVNAFREYVRKNNL